MTQTNKQQQFIRWQEIFKNWQSDGSSGLEFCRKNQLSSNQFYYWKELILGAKKGRKTSPRAHQKKSQLKTPLTPTFTELVDSTSEVLPIEKLSTEKLPLEKMSVIQPKNGDFTLSFPQRGLVLTISDNFCELNLRRLLEVIASC